MRELQNMMDGPKTQQRENLDEGRAEEQSYANEEGKKNKRKKLTN